MKIYNTLTGQKETFSPLIPDRVGMYVCGVTVYDYCHLGHARSALVFDVLRRYLEHHAYRVTFVKNFTDVDDKIINRAKEQGISWQEITSKYINAYRQDMNKLGVRPATVEPKATEHMAQIIDLVQSLLDQEMAYRVDGDVYFDVEKFPSYGMLSKRKLTDMQAGARVEVDERKRHPMDFALWKSAKPGEPDWPSPWGRGRPGWHIECSAMAMKHLTLPLDIHGGGEDLIFPHHENEIAQSSGSTGTDFVRYWVHNGFVRVNQEKMSKSLGNFFTIREIFEKSRWSDDYTAEMLRYLLLGTHYRGPLDFSDQALEEAKRVLDAFYDVFGRLGESSTDTAGDALLQESIDTLNHDFHESMDDDLNTPVALASFQQFRANVNKLLEKGLSSHARGEAREVFRRFGALLGLFQLHSWQFNPPIKIAVEEKIRIATGENIKAVEHPTGGVKGLSDAEIHAKVAQRNEARRQKDFKKADQIRAELSSAGITIEDRPDGTSRWKR
jgi:cysteinyl-tRNA synthetase